MQYQDCIEEAQAAADEGPRHADAHINPSTGLATDYLNHFNEAIMLLELLPDCPDCRTDFLAWRPMSYREHFAASRFKARDLAIASYEAADPALRHCLDALAGTMNAVLEATRAAMTSALAPQAEAEIARHAAAWLKPLVARAGAVINGSGNAGADAPQTVVDGLMTSWPTSAPIPNVHSSPSARPSCATERC
jgi:hypothetical protein